MEDAMIDKLTKERAREYDLIYIRNITIIKTREE